MNKQQLAAKIWESANKMRSKIEANEYKDYILGFIFYKYLSDKQEQWLLKRDYAPAAAEPTMCILPESLMPSTRITDRVPLQSHI